MTNKKKVSDKRQNHIQEKPINIDEKLLKEFSEEIEEEYGKSNELFI